MKRITLIVCMLSRGCLCLMSLPRGTVHVSGGSTLTPFFVLFLFFKRWGRKDRNITINRPSLDVRQKRHLEFHCRADYGHTLNAGLVAL